MAFEVNWDVQKYRTKYEGDARWSLKEKFINAHKTRFAEEQLICLAQVFLNIEFMGCRYPAKIMALVADLGTDVAHEFRKSRNNRFKPTFVNASEAFEARCKTNKDDDVTISKKKQAKFEKSIEDIMIRAAMPKQPKIESKNDSFRIFYNKHPDLILSQSTEKLDAIRVVLESLKNLKIHVKYEWESRQKVWIKCHGNRMLFGESKLDVNEKVLEELQKYFYTVKTKVKFLSRFKIIEKTDRQLVNIPLTVSPDHTELDSSNLGFKLLQPLEWTGVGLGSIRKGIEEPIQADIKINRTGLGNVHTGKLNHNVLLNMLKEYKATNDLCDLIFSPEFTNDERTTIFKMAKRFNLKPTYFGKKACPQVIVSKRCTIEKLFVTLLNTTDPFCKEKYEVIPPTELSSQKL